MTKKKRATKFARTLRRATKCDFVTSIRVTKVYIGRDYAKFRDLGIVTTYSGDTAFSDGYYYHHFMGVNLDNIKF